MGGSEGDIESQKNPVFLHEKDNYPKGIRTEDIAQIPVVYPSAGKLMIKNDSVVYPGRSVLYSRKFHPLDRIINSESKKPPVR